MEWLYWCLVVGTVGIVIHAHDFAVATGGGLRPESPFEWLVVAAGFVWTFTVWTVGAFLLGLLLTVPNGTLFALGGAAVGVAISIPQVVSMSVFSSSAGTETGPRWIVWIMLARVLVTRLAYGLLGGGGLYLILG